MVEGGRFAREEPLAVDVGEIGAVQVDDLVLRALQFNPGMRLGNLRTRQWKDAGGFPADGDWFFAEDEFAFLHRFA